MTIQYYQDNANSFFENTIDVYMEELYQPFVDLLPPNALILDAGCGSGRDSKALLEKGFRVEAFDASSEMVRLAKSVTNLDVQLQRFDQVDAVEHYDAIWTCASLLHVPENELLHTMSILKKSLKENGIWYMSFKYGDSQREKDGRIFTDMNEDRFAILVRELGGVVVNMQWITTDKRKDRNEKWINFILES